MILTWKQVALYVGVGVLLGILIGSYAACKLSASPMVKLPGTTFVATPAIHDTTVRVEYTAGKPYLVVDATHDTVNVPIPAWHITDTIRYTSEHYSYRDTCLQSALPSLSGAIVKSLAGFEANGRSHLVELWASAEHDFIGGYGAALDVDVNLGTIGFAPITVYGSVGFTRGLNTAAAARLAIGVSGEIYHLGN